MNFFRIVDYSAPQGDWRSMKQNVTTFVNANHGESGIENFFQNRVFILPFFIHIRDVAIRRANKKLMADGQKKRDR